ncbi:prepilin-type N-terminal cleavage/methylation domain-containing protein [Pseudomonas sp. EpS/L25]|uniref:prepilin-type N-terminal cleavage/methylation domain-containing protein n=1 Tax=Pseudomonas sp. EpS/L25 TaxID=1749078 RepID=UPI0007441C39|nr:prepilin-type N-terminal cleavage/methylation domain-containing protein [Pseudomonas sp. EpS/L25]KUM41941.1 hypothetical protein AR540_06875 [Pseudomonas sp. EpS/L25]
MPLSPRQRGFTLVEILIVLLLLGIVTSLAVVNVGPPSLQRMGKLEGSRLASLLEYMQDQSLLEYRYYRLSVTPDEYQVFIFDEAKELWVMDSADKSHRLPEGLKLQLSLKDDSVATLGTLVDGRGESMAVTNVLVAPDGSLSPFSLALYENESKLVVFSLASDGLNISSAEGRKE